ncbi:MAG: hypothetical protein MRY83_14115 [Flavobacteriales bacterium]|nr:hypothetical protein [Flavobacteriales bacterium]
MSELKKMSAFPRLTSASFSGTNLNDHGLKILSSFDKLENLDLQETDISNFGISYLKSLKTLKHLRLKENPQLDNECVSYLNDCKCLINLQIHETNINEVGLLQLHIKGLQDVLVNIDDDNYSFQFLMSYSKRYPKCTILAKGKGEFFNGTFKGTWGGR